MKRIRMGGNDFKGFIGELDKGKINETLLPKADCVLCDRLKEKDGRWLCDGKRKCPHIKDLKKGILHNCVSF